MTELNPDTFRARIQQALDEDVGEGDITSETVSLFDRHVQGEITAKQHGIVAGLELARLVFEEVDDRVEIHPLVSDGTLVSDGEALVRLEGRGGAILRGERTALNLLGRLSGIATLTRTYVNAVEGSGTRILDTRKTTPLWRDAEKYAVRVGGGMNHRMGLYDMVLIKENHIRWAGGLAKAIQRCISEVGEARSAIKIEVEVADFEELETALEAGVDRILLDNMTPEQVREAVNVTRNETTLEVSGGITLENIGEYAKAGADFISVGAFTHSANAFDVSLLIREATEPPGGMQNQKVKEK